tara:strand:- start:274 stop:468 length:195 start_codon:yes stop_codon:yes gene_type:complete
MMQLDNIEIELEWPHNIDILDLRKFIVSNFPKEVEIIRWYISDIKILSRDRRKVLLKISASILN